MGLAMDSVNRLAKELIAAALKVKRTLPLLVKTRKHAFVVHHSLLIKCFQRSKVLL